MDYGSLRLFPVGTTTLIQGGGPAFREHPRTQSRPVEVLDQDDGVRDQMPTERHRARGDDKLVRASLIAGYHSSNRVGEMQHYKFDASTGTNS
jgi:hypothetical protein